MPIEVRSAISKIFSASLVGSFSTTLGIILFANLFGGQVLGTYFLYQALIGILGIPADLGISKAVEKRISSGSSTSETIGAGIVGKILLFATVTCSLLAVQGHVHTYVGQSLIEFLIVGLAVHQAALLSVRTLSGELRPGETAIFQAIQKITWVIVGGILTMYLGGVEGLIIGRIAGDLLLLGGCVSRIESTIAIPSIKRIIDLLQFGRYIMITSIGGYVYNWLDIAILGLFVGAPTIATYEYAWRVASLFILPTQAIRQVIFPQISEWAKQGRYKDIEKLLLNWVQPPLLLIVPGIVGAVLFGNEILEFVFASPAPEATILISVFLVEKFVRAAHLTWTPALFALNKPTQAYRGSVAAVSTNIALNLTLIPIFDSVGAAIATSISGGVSALVGYHYLSEHLALELPLKRLVYSISAATIMGFVLWVSQMVIPVDNIVRLIVYITTGAGIYLGVLTTDPEIRGRVYSFMRGEMRSSS